ncbi:MAG: glycosyltransferase family 9 protein [Bacteroidales bacterium]|nr:glycosyltransferase family 9 protein [Bacteroidales bacterium]
MKKVLIIQTASIGDVILATPILEKLHHVFPDANIDFLVKKGNESLLKDHPFLHEVLIWNKNSQSYLHFDQLMHRVWSIRYDLVVNVQRFFMTGLMTAFSRAGIKTGFDKNPLSFLYTRKIKHKIGDGVHEIDRNLSLVEEFPDPKRYLPRLYPSPDDENEVQCYKTGIYYTISPASLWFTKQYPVELWTELVQKIPADDFVYLLGSPVDRELCDKICFDSGHPHIANLSGQLTFLQSAALMKGSRMNFTNDSAPMHLASAVNARVTVVYCSTVPEFGFGPLSENSSIVQVPEKLACRPCGLHGYQACPEKHFRCAYAIPQESLLKHL